MKRIIILIFFLQISYVYSQQDKLNEVFYFGSDYLAMTSVIPTDSGYILAGMCYGKIAVCLVDSSANLKWIKLFSDTTFFHTLGYVPDNFKKTSTGNYIAVGTIQNGLATYNRLFLLKLDSNFNEVYMKAILNDTACDGCLHGRYIFENSNHNYVLLGANSRDSLGVLNTNGFQDGLIIGTDNSGTIQNYKLLTGPSNFTDFLDCGLQMGNNYYLFGATYSFAPSYVTNPWNRIDGWVVKTDLQGNEISSAAFGNPELMDGTFTNCVIASGNKIATTFKKTLQYVNISWGVYIYQTGLLVLNDDLSINKEIYFTGNEIVGDSIRFSEVSNIILDQDSSFVFLGSKGIMDNDYYWGFKKGLIVKMNRNYNINYSREYIYPMASGITKDFYVSCISNTGDRGFIFGGYIRDDSVSSGITQSWLVKTDSLGCDGFHSCDDTTLVCEILQAPDTACKNDTAWLQVKFKGRSAPYFIYANNTLALDSIYYPYTLPLWIDTLIPYKPTTIGMQQVIIKVKDPWGWHNSDTVQIFVKNCGSGNIEEAWYPKKVEIYPNPASTELRVKIRTTITNPIAITIYNMQGKTVKQITTKQNETVIDVNELEQGVYGVKVIGCNINFSDRFVKM